MGVCAVSSMIPRRGIPGAAYYAFRELLRAWRLRKYAQMAPTICRHVATCGAARGYAVRHTVADLSRCAHVAPLVRFATRQMSTAHHQLHSKCGNAGLECRGRSARNVAQRAPFEGDALRGHGQSVLARNLLPACRLRRSAQYIRDAEVWPKSESDRTSVPAPTWRNAYCVRKCAILGRSGAVARIGVAQVSMLTKTVSSQVSTAHQNTPETAFW